jgi:hypothetical protein
MGSTELAKTVETVEDFSVASSRSDDEGTGAVSILA